MGKRLSNFHKTLIFTIIFSLIVTAIAVLIQIYGEADLTINCSYIDPFTIDLLAFLASIFLMIEGFYRIYEHKNALIKTQFTRAIRVAFGSAIFTLHSMQFIVKFFF